MTWDSTFKPEEFWPAPKICSQEKRKNSEEQKSYSTDVYKQIKANRSETDDSLLIYLLISICVMIIRRQKIWDIREMKTISDQNSGWLLSCWSIRLTGWCYWQIWSIMFMWGSYCQWTSEMYEMISKYVSAFRCHICLILVSQTGSEKLSCPLRDRQSPDCRWRMRTA